MAPRAQRLSAAGFAVLGLTLAGAVLRFAELGHQGLWYDESFTALLVGLSPGRMIGLIPHTESTPPLYYCVAWAWVRLFGRGAFGLRSLSALAGVAVIPLAYGAAAELLRSRRAGVVCAALAAFNPFLWWYSQEARSYELLTALTALSLFTFARARAQPGAARLMAWALASALALATHYFAAIIVVPEAALLLGAHRRRRPVQVAVALVAACGAALIPLAISQNGTGNDHWIAHEPLRLRLAQILPQFLIGTGAPQRTVLKFLALALALCALALLAGVRPVTRGGAAIAGGLALAGFAIALALLAVGFDDLITRNLIELWLPAAICLSAGLAAARAPRVGIALTAALCAIGLVAIVGVDVNVRLQRPEWPRLARTLGLRPPPGQTRLILIQREPALLPLSHYLPGLHKLTAATRVSRLDVIAMHSPRQPLCWWGAQCNLISSTLQRRFALSGFSLIGERRISQFRIEELRARRPTLITRGEVARALTQTELHHDLLAVQSGPAR
jgi:mannosyltransferase